MSTKLTLSKAVARAADQLARQRFAKRMASGGDPLDELGKRLQSAHPHLILRVENTSGLEYEFTPYISEVDRGWDEVIAEAYDSDGSPLGPVYYRIIRRGDEELYCSTFLLTRDKIVGGFGFGQKGLAYCDPATGVAVAQIESVITTNSEPVGDRLDEVGKRLRSARPHLFARTESADGKTHRYRTYTSEADEGWDELFEEGYDANHGPLGPVLWRTVRRGKELLYCSTFLVTRDQIIRGWGSEALAFCDHTGSATARVETAIHDVSEQAPQIEIVMHNALKPRQ